MFEKRAGRAMKMRLRSILFLLPAWYLPSSSLRSAFHRLRGVRVAPTAEIGYMVIIEHLYPEKVVIEDGATVSARSTILVHEESTPYTVHGEPTHAGIRIERGR